MVKFNSINFIKIYRPFTTPSTFIVNEEISDIYFDYSMVLINNQFPKYLFN